MHSTNPRHGEIRNFTYCSFVFCTLNLLQIGILPEQKIKRSKPALASHVNTVKGAFASGKENLVFFFSFEFNIVFQSVLFITNIVHFRTDIILSVLYKQL